MQPIMYLQMNRLRRLVVYVKSVKTVTGTKEYERRTLVRKLGDRPNRIEVEGKIMKGTFVLKAYETETEPQYEFVLSEDQQRIVELVKEVASDCNLEVEIVDVAKENALHRAIRKEFEKIKTFPTVSTGSGEILTGVTTKKQLEAFLSKATRTN